MELASIERLLEKYLNAETTIAEEKILKQYFTSDTIAPHLEEYQSLFSYFTISKKEELTKPIQLKSQKMNWKWLSIAASVVLLISVYTGYNDYQEQKEAEKVYAQTMGHFQFLAENLNKGNVAIAQLQHFEETKNKIFK